MSEPRRWLDDDAVAPQVKHLLAAEVGTGLPNAVRERVAAKLSVALGIGMLAAGASVAAKAGASASIGSSGAGASTAGAATGSTAGSITAASVSGAAVGASGVASKAIVLASIFGVAVGTTALGWVFRAEPTTLAASSSVRAAALPSTEISSTVASSTEGARTAAPRSEVASVVASPSAKPRPARANAPRAASSSAPPPHDFADEVSSLRAANALLATEPAAALQQLARHGRDYPRSQLSAERELLTLRALLALGRRSDAEALSVRLLTSSEAKLYHERVRSLLQHVEQRAEGEGEVKVRGLDKQQRLEKEAAR